MNHSYSHHARQQMARRKITEADVESVLLAPGTSYPGQNGTSFVYLGQGQDGRPIKVVTDSPDPTGDGATIITTARRDSEE